MVYVPPAEFPYQDEPSTETPVYADALNGVVLTLADLDGAGGRVAALERHASVSVADHGAVGDGVADDTAAVQAAIDAAIAAKVPLHLPAGEFLVSGPLWWNDPYPRISGVGGGRSVLVAATDGFDVLRVGTGTGQDGARHYGHLHDFGIEGFGNRPAKIPGSSRALLVLDNVKFATVARLFLNRGDVCLDLRNNCYGTSFHDCAIGRYGESNVGINLRAGPQSGNDLPFYNCWVSGATAGYHVSGAFTNLRLYGGQASNKQPTANVPADERGVFVLGRDYDTGAVGNLGQITCDGVDVEGWSQGWAVRGFAEIGALAFRNCTFLATTEGADMASGIIKLTAAGQSQLAFEDCEAKGYFTQAQIAQVTGSFSRFGMFERNWFASTATQIAGVAQTQGWMTNLRAQSGLTVGGFAVAYRGSRTELDWQGVLLRTNAGVLEQSNDQGVTWRPATAAVPHPPRDLPYAATITADARDGNYRTTTLTGDTNLNPPSNPVGGQMWRWRGTPTGATRTVNLATGLRRPAHIPATLQVAAGQRIDVGLLHEAGDGWTILAAQVA